MYDCPPISEDEVTRLEKVIKNRAELKDGRDLPKPGKRTSQDLPKEIQNQLQSIQRAESRRRTGGDRCRNRCAPRQRDAR